MSTDDAPDLGGAATLLLVDDEPGPRLALLRVLRHAGYQVEDAGDGDAAVQILLTGNIDVVITDIFMPGMSGIELLQFVRAHDADLPVILVTGAPAVETAIQALDHGAFKYMLKPVGADELEATVHSAVLMRRMARVRKEARKLSAETADPNLRRSFELAKRTLWMAFQPIVTSDGTLYGHEALMRARSPSLPHPGAVLEAAETLGELDELGRLVRRLAAAPVVSQPAAGTLFVNLHPSDLEDDELVSPDAPLAQIASRVVLEITERSSVASVQNLRQRVIKLRSAGYRIAVDDLGAGYAGLTSFALLEPDIVKIDMSLVRDVDKLPVKQQLILSIARLCRQMGIEVVAEGVETAAERDMVLQLGCDLLQGYYLAKPDRPFPSFKW